MFIKLTVTEYSPHHKQYINLGKTLVNINNICCIERNEVTGGHFTQIIMIRGWVDVVESIEEVENLIAEQLQERVTLPHRPGP